MRQLCEQWASTLFGLSCAWATLKRIFVTETSSLSAQTRSALSTQFRITKTGDLLRVSPVSLPPSSLGPGPPLALLAEL
jgi:hypothetical protein